VGGVVRLDKGEACLEAGVGGCEAHPPVVVPPDKGVERDDDVGLELPDDVHELLPQGIARRDIGVLVVQEDDLGPKDLGCSLHLTGPDALQLF